MQITPLVKRLGAVKGQVRSVYVTADGEVAIYQDKGGRNYCDNLWHAHPATNLDEQKVWINTYKEVCLPQKTLKQILASLSGEYGEKIRPLRKGTAVGIRYLSACGRFAFTKTFDNWYCKKLVDHGWRKEFVLIDSIPPQKSLDDLIARLEGKINIKIRPLKQAAEEGLWLSSCRTFRLIRSQEGWQVEIAPLYVEDPAPTNTLMEDWFVRHGLDIPVSTLDEAAKRLEEACAVDNPSEFILPLYPAISS